jgi:hypothetical protein
MADSTLPEDVNHQFSLLDGRNTVYVIEVSTSEGWIPVTSTKIDWVAIKCRKRLSRRHTARVCPQDISR